MTIKTAPTFAISLALLGCLLVPEPVPATETATTVRKARQLLDSGRVEEAVVLLHGAVQERPDSVELQAFLGRTAYLGRQYVVAEEALRQAVRLGRRDVATWFYFCSTLWEIGRMAEAEEVCQEAIRDRGPQLPLAHLLGRLYLWQGRWEEAVVWLEKAALQSRDSVDLWLDLAGGMEGAGRAEEALHAYRQALALAPEHYQVRYGLARALAQTGDREGAARELAIYQELLREDQSRTLEQGRLTAQIEHGRELLQQGEAAQAAAHLEELPRTVEVLEGLADAYEQLGRSEDSVRALEQAVALAPERGDLRIRLSAARLAEGPTP